MTSIEWNDCGSSKTVVLIPGWATDSRIFAGLSCPANLLVVKVAEPAALVTDLMAELDRRHLETVTVFGFSMGGFLAAELAAQIPERISHLFLAGVRKSYVPEELAVLRRKLMRSPAAWLQAFYRQCAGSEEERSAMATLIPEYVSHIDLDRLNRGLDYLATARVFPSGCPFSERVVFVHGLADRIAPISEVLSLHQQWDGTRLWQIPEAGHVPFLHSEFQLKWEVFWHEC